jgi:hypothetical protein
MRDEPGEISLRVISPEKMKDNRLGIEARPFRMRAFSEGALPLGNQSANLLAAKRSWLHGSASQAAWLLSAFNCSAW